MYFEGTTEEHHKKLAENPNSINTVIFKWIITILVSKTDTKRVQVGKEKGPYSQ